MTATILWHDYETWGVNPKVDFPVQFAAVRTDLNLNVIATTKPMNWVCKIPHDYLPHPVAALVTGITPAFSLRKGMIEPEFADKIYQQMIAPNTCTAGYNSIKFDEEVTRHLFFRNFFPVYDREYKQGNSRWDVIDLVRAAYALRPDNINWPLYEDGKPCFKLDQLSTANQISHQNAHDALSDVYATIGIAKLILQHQPKLYEYYWQLRDKQKVLSLLQPLQAKMLVHISGFIASEQGCCSIIMPVCRHPKNPNSVLCIDLNRPIAAFEGSDPKQLKALLFDSTIDSAERPGVFNIATNKVPFVAPLNTLSEARAQVLNIDLDLCKKRFLQLKQVENLASLVGEAFSQDSQQTKPSNIDESLYSSDFPSPSDTLKMEQIRKAEPQQLLGFHGNFEAEHLNTLLFRYRARNFPHTLTESELFKWSQHIETRFTSTNKKECLSISEFYMEIEALSQEYQNHPNKLQLLNSLRSYAQSITGQ